MNPDNSQKFSASDSEKLSLILTGVQSLTVRFDNIDSRFNNMDSRLLRVEQNVNELREGQQRLEEGQRELQEGQIRLHKTVLQVEDGQRQVREAQERVSTEVYALGRDVRDRFLVLSGATNAEVKELQKRGTCLEANSNPPKPQT